MLRLHQLKDTDGSGNEDRSVVGNFSVEEVTKAYFLWSLFPSPVHYKLLFHLSCIFWFIAVVAARGSYVGHFKPCIFIHEFAITLYIQNYMV